MSNCEKCGNNIIPMVISCVYFNDQALTDQGIRSKILGCPDFVPSLKVDYVARDQSGAVL